MPSTASAPPVGLRLAAAGGIAGGFSNLVLFPLDTVKTLRQSDPTRYRNAVGALASVLRTAGVRGLYRGVTTAAVGSALSSAIYFGTYEAVRRHLASSAPRAPRNALAAAAGNVASSALFVPKEVVKQRMQAGLSPGGPVAAAVSLVRAGGVRALYTGYGATLLRNVPSTAVRFVLYEEAKIALAKRGKRRLSHVEHVVAGAVAGSLASAAVTPMDVIKTRFATGAVRPGASIVGVAMDIVRDAGVKGLYVGVRPRVLWSGLFAAIGFTSYEMCKNWLVPSYDGNAVKTRRQ